MSAAPGDDRIRETIESDRIAPGDELLRAGVVYRSGAFQIVEPSSARKTSSGAIP